MRGVTLVRWQSVGAFEKFCLIPLYQCADAVLGEELQEHGMGHAPVEDDDALHALLDRMMQASTSGIMPPVMVPSAIRPRLLETTYGA